ncbi:competence/damage-inducible protein A [Proteiniclasticum ruminis]|uniref:competence/damage-inducible protein A n=1 Tax=Proteiniclasticum ruminis TaxID=398199 RepID=UPI0028A98207|nr:competence/damage-inducible protein A [Proteiniclasticum ruminis]
MNAEIMAVGTELLLGDIVNTNAQYLAKELALLGFGIYRQTTVGDNEVRLETALKEALKEADIVITTGGLGPTPDDITKEISAKVFSQELVLHEPSYKVIETYFRNNARAMENGNQKQAMFPASAIVLDNPNGTAPGCIIIGPENKFIINLPGPPREMKPMFENKVKPFLLQFMEHTIISKTLRCIGLGEWDMATRVKDLIDSSENPTVAPYAKDGESILRITARAKTEEEARMMISPVEEEIRRRIGEYIYGIDEDTLEDVIGRELVSHNKSIAIAESVTGGMIASRLLSFEGGMSKVLNEAFVTYSDESKMKYLGVKEETLRSYGAVSEETAKEMAQGLHEATGSEVCLVTTGIAGPTGGSEEKPVGLVYIGIYLDGAVHVWKRYFTGGRERIRIRTTIAALDYLRRLMNGIEVIE